MNSHAMSGRRGASGPRNENCAQNKLRCRLRRLRENQWVSGISCVIFGLNPSKMTKKRVAFDEDDTTNGAKLLKNAEGAKATSKLLLGGLEVNEACFESIASCVLCCFPASWTGNCARCRWRTFSRALAASCGLVWY